MASRVMLYLLTHFLLQEKEIKIRFTCSAPEMISYSADEVQIRWLRSPLVAAAAAVGDERLDIWFWLNDTSPF